MPPVSLFLLSPDHESPQPLKHQDPDEAN
ncbi:hypothetical protein CP8484711_2233A, partial [Chlamydia psittaci 84-8471/1]